MARLWLVMLVLVVAGATPASAETPDRGGLDVVVIGGHQAVSDDVMSQLEDLTTGAVSRVGGADRYATAAAVAEAAFRPGVPVAYIATSKAFPDALVAGPVAAREGGPILLAKPAGPVPAATRQALEWLEPARVVVVGGTRAVAADVSDELEAITGVGVERVAGPTRYETAAAVSANEYAPGVARAFIATGLNFPDALAATPAAALAGGPILLTATHELPAATRAELERVQPRQITVVGGTAAVGQRVEELLAEYTDGPVDRVGGATREATAAALSRMAFPDGAETAFLATGADFPDALAVGPAASGGSGVAAFAEYLPAAGDRVGPVLLTRGTRLTSETTQELERLGGAPNRPPVADGQAVTTPFGTPVEITLHATDPDGDPLTYSITTEPDNGSVTGTGPDVTYTPDAAFAGTDSFAFVASDGIDVSDPATVTVTVEPPPPPVARDVAATAAFETPVVLTLDADSASGGPLTFHYTQPSDGTVTGAGPDVTYTPDPGFHGTDTFGYHVNDGFNDSNTASVTVTVEPQAPEAHDVSAETDQADPVVITLDATSPSGQPLTYHYAQPTAGTVTGAGPDVTYTPDAGFHGIDTFTYHANDGFNDSNTATVAVTVHPAPPVAHDQTVNASKDMAVVITLGVDNPSGGSLTFHYTQPGDGTVTGAGPDVIYTPDSGFEGTDTFTFHANDTFNDSNTATVTIHVTPPAPEAHDVSETTDQDTPVVITLDATNHSANPLTYHYAQPADGTVTGAGPDVTYTPDPGFHGTDTFGYHVNDGFNDSNTATVTVTVDPLPPVAHDVSTSTAFETPVVVTLDADSLSGGPLTHHYNQPDNGTVTGAGPDVTYTPDPGFQGTDTFTYHVNDGFNDSNTATVTITVEPPPPVAHDVSETTDQDTPVVITLDATNHSANPLTYHYAQPADGTVTGAGPDVTYTPDPGFFGTDTFTFHVNDGFNDSNTATVTITVNFTAEDYDFAAVGNTLLEVGVAASGDPAVRVDATLLDDAEADFEVVDVDTSAASGEVDWSADGTFTYRPAAGLVGDDAFTYTISDGAVSGVGTVTVTVSDMVWYVDDDASGDGRSWSPFASLAEAESASGSGDVIFVYEATGAYTDGIALQADQALLGEEAGLSVAGHDLVEAGARPAVAPASGDAIVLASGVHVEGIDVTGGPLRGLVASDAGATVTVTGVDVAGVAGNAVHLTGAGDITLDGVDVTNTGGSAVFLSGLAGTVTHDGAITQSGTTPAVAVADLLASADVSLGAVTSGASGITVTGTSGDVEIASATLGSTDTRIVGEPGLAVSASGGTVTIGSLTAYTQNAPAVVASGSGTVATGGGSVDAQGAPALHLSSSGGAIELATAISSGSTGHGLELDNVTGSVDLDGGAITGSSGNAVHVSGGSVDLSAAVSVTNASGNAVRVNGLTSGAVTLSGAIIDTGSGVDLTTNTGSTIAFTGALDITTSGSTAFSALGGGTVTATASGSELESTNARALRVESTSIGAAGLTFQSISASGAQHGIHVADAGSGPLVVAGDGTTDRNGSGGTITGMSSHGVTLVGAGPVTLRNMDVEANDAVGIRAEGVSGLTVVGARIVDNTTDQDNPATRNSVYLRELTGSVRLEDSLVTGSAHNQVDVENTSGTVTIDVLRSEIRANDINSGLQVEALGTSNVTLNVRESTFAETHAAGVHAFARNSSQLTVTIDGNTFEDNNVAVNLAAQHTATMRSTVTDNQTSGHPSHSINVTVHEDAVHDTTVTGNDIDGGGTVASVGIRLVIEEDSTMRALVEDNTVSALTSGHGFRVLAREDAGQLHLVLRNNDMQSTSMSPAYEILVLHESYMCGVIEGNTGTSSNPSRDLLVDLFDAGASADIEGLALGPATEAELEAHLTAQNPPLRVRAFVATPSNVFGVAPGTCERPAS